MIHLTYTTLARLPWH